MALVIIYSLTQMGHLQNDPTPISVDNLTIQIKQSKAWDMQLHWLCDKENKKM